LAFGRFGAAGARRRVRQGLQPLLGNRLSTLAAAAEGAVGDAGQRSVDLVQDASAATSARWTGANEMFSWMFTSSWMEAMT
jgi:hypothetical protein